MASACAQYTHHTSSDQRHRRAATANQHSSYMLSVSLSAVAHGYLGLSGSSLVSVHTYLRDSRAPRDIFPTGRAQIAFATRAARAARAALLNCRNHDTKPSKYCALLRARLLHVYVCLGNYSWRFCTDVGVGLVCCLPLMRQRPAAAASAAAPPSRSVRRRVAPRCTSHRHPAGTAVSQNDGQPAGT